MLVNPLTGLLATFGVQSSANKISNRPQDSLLELLGANTRNADTVDGLSIAASLQNGVSSLRQANTNIAQSVSQSQVAEDGISSIVEELSKLQELAQQANTPTLSATDRAALNKQFQAELKNIDAIVNNTQFGGQKLLDGSRSGKDALSLTRALGIESQSNQDKVEIPSLSAASLLGKNLDISTQAGAQAAIDAIATGAQKIGAVYNNVKAFEENLSFTGAILDSALFTQDALRASFTADDFAGTSPGFSITSPAESALKAQLAQENRLPPSLVQLIT